MKRKSDDGRLRRAAPRVARVKTPEDICPDLPEWPMRWRGYDKDVPYGQGLVDAMRPFMVYLIALGLSSRTIRSHMSFLWLLGGEIIGSVNCHDEYGIPPLLKLKQSVDDEGGPYCRHLDSESEARAFDATCRKLHKFLEQEGRVVGDARPVAPARKRPASRKGTRKAAVVGKKKRRDET
jgi:hypothetical protein